MAFHGDTICRVLKYGMPPVKKPPHERQQHFLRAWRKYRKISQETAAERGMISRSLLSKIEAGDIPYNQDLMERLALAYGCQVADLVSRDPTEQPRIPIFDLPKGDADRVHDFIRALRISRTDEEGRPSEEPAPAPASTPKAKPKRERA